MPLWAPARGCSKSGSKGDHLTIEANPDYWGGEPPIKTLIYKPVPEKSQRLNLLLAGEADITIDLNPDDIPSLEGDPQCTVCRLPRAAGGCTLAFRPTFRATLTGVCVTLCDMRLTGMQLNNGLLGGLAEHRGTVLVTGKAWIPPTVKPWAT